MKTVFAVIIAIISLVASCALTVLFIKGLISLLRALFTPTCYISKEEREAGKAARRLLRAERKRRSRKAVAAVAGISALAFVVYLVSKGPEGFKALEYVDGELKETIIGTEKPGALEAVGAAIRAAITTAKTFARVIQIGK